MAVDPARAKSLFLSASDLSDPAERAAYLERECGANAELRARVEALLRANEGAPSPPAGTEGPTIDSDAAQLPTGPTGAHTPTPGASNSPATVTADYRSEAKPNVLIAGRYILQERIGEGGMGEVWVAKQTEPVKRRVALKLIKPGMDSRAVLQRFEQERQALAMMDHPNIAKVLDAGLTPNGQPFFVMELVNGLPLNKFCDELKLTPDERLELFVPICQAVQHAHQKGIVHRDLKPANILITMIDGKPEPKVIGFGVAKATDGKLTDESLSTQFGAVVGTLEYMSPEQAGFTSEDIDTRSDIYSLGVILYELLTGLRPIDAKRLKKAALIEMIRIIREEEPSKPSTRLATDESLPSLAALRQTEPRRLMTILRGELDWVVMKCLEKSRDRRYETVNALSRDVQRYLADEPVEARPPSAGYRLQKFVRRNRGQVTAATIVLGSILLGATVASWQAVVARRAEKRAKADRDTAKNALIAESAARQRADDARRQTELALDESQRKSARMTYERAQTLCEQGKADLGLLWMVRSLELTPDQDNELDRAIRASINLWARQLNTFDPRQVSMLDWALTQEILDIAVSPDGQKVLVLGSVYDKPIGGPRLHNLLTGKLVVEFPLEENAPASGVMAECRAVLSANARYVAASRGDSFARVWNAATGQLVGKPIGHTAAVRGVSFDPTGNVLATATGTSVRFIKVETGEMDGLSLSLEHDADGVEISPDGRLVLAWSPDRVTVWDFTSRQLLHSLDGINYHVVSAKFSLDGRYILANGTNEAQFWESATGKPIGARMRWSDHMSPGWIAHRPTFRSDGRVVVTGGFPIRMGAVPTGEPVGATSLAAESYFPAFTKDGKRLIVQGRMLDVAPGLLAEREYMQEYDVADLVISPDSRTLAIQEWTGDRRQNRMIDLRSGKAIGEPLVLQFTKGPAAVPVFSPDGSTVAILSGTNSCEIRDAITEHPRSFALTMEGAIRAVGFSPDGSIIATGDEGGVVRLWNAVNGQTIGKAMRHRYSIWRLKFSPNGGMLLAAGGVIGGRDGEARLWNVATSEPHGLPIDILGTVQDAAISPDGESMAIGAFQLSVWGTTSSRQRWRDTRYDIWQVAFSPDSQHVLAHSWALPLAGIYDVRTGALTANMKHQVGIERSAMSPDGRLVLTCGSDLVTRVWDASTGLPLGPPWKNAKRPPRGVFEVDSQGTLLVGARAIERWELAPPIEGTRERVRLSVEVMTRLRLDDRDEMQPFAPSLAPETAQLKKAVLTEDPFVPAWKRLQKVGGPVGYLRR